MTLRFFFDKRRPVHMGGYPLERLARANAMPDLKRVPTSVLLDFRRRDAPERGVEIVASTEPVNAGGLSAPSSLRAIAADSVAVPMPRSMQISRAGSIRRPAAFSTPPDC
jgi:hypothetical protein